MIDYGRKLTPDEIIECIAGSGEAECCACGERWEDHHVRCEGSLDIIEARAAIAAAKGE